VNSALTGLAVTMMLLPPPGGVPQSLDSLAPPSITAPEWIVYDATSDVVLAAKNPDGERAMASVTKIMTALVVRDHTQLDDRVRASHAAVSVGESEIGLVEGEVWTVRDLLEAMLIRSGNDAAMALAEHVGGSIDGFAAMMNAKAISLGLTHSHFVNPHGLDIDGHYTSARDLSIMAKALLDDPVLAEIVRTRFVAFRADPSGVARQARTTNRLLGVFPGVVGVKTGFTNNALRVLVAALQRNGRTIITVVMGSEDHFADTAELLAYGFGAVTLRDRLAAPLLAEEGGGGVGEPQRFTPSEKARLEAVLALPDGQATLTAPNGTERVTRIRAFLRSIAPVLLGGSG
jgi:serine-type D-Ala-D-Ala carboxypeptidase (penicillin-binding protein 5/6)